ncbi:hypothetical protein ES703_124205 [subsurface metagenome]
MKYPKSITATFRIVINGNGSQAEGDNQVELISRIMSQASGLDPECQELLFKFAFFLKKPDKKADPSS